MQIFHELLRDSPQYINSQFCLEHVNTKDINILPYVRKIFQPHPIYDEKSKIQNSNIIAPPLR